MISKITLALLFCLDAQAALKAVATTPDAAWLLHRVGGNFVEVKALAKSGDNYHFLDARPDFILAVNRADIVCRVGAELEIGWLPKILEKAANAKVMPGAPGDCDLSRSVVLEEKPTGAVDRSMGDAHRGGNPHFWFSPSQMAKASAEVEARLTELDPAHGKDFAANRAVVEKELGALELEMKKKLKAWVGKSAYQYHRDFSYFFSTYGLRNLGSIEEIPGVAPSAARLGKVALEAKTGRAGVALATEHDPASALNKFSQSSAVPVLVLPSSLKNPAEPDAYRKWQESLAAALLEKK